MATLTNVDTHLDADGGIAGRKSETLYDACFGVMLSQLTTNHMRDVLLTTTSEPRWPEPRIVQSTIRLTHEEAIELIEALINTVEPNAFAMDMENL